MTTFSCDICGKVIARHKDEKYVLRLEKVETNGKWKFFDEKHICSNCFPKIENAIGPFILEEEC